MTRCLVLTDGVAGHGPYGVNLLQRLGYDLVDVHPASNRLHIKLRDVVEHRLGRPVDKTLRSIPKAFTADVVLAFLESQALSASWLKSRRLPPFATRPLVALACWLADELQAMPAPQRRAVARAYRGVDLTLVWSTNQIDILVDAGFPADGVEAIRFGFAPELHPRVDPTTRGTSLYAIGSDRGRDYPTLLRAMAGLDVELELFAKPSNLEGAVVPPNVRFRGTVPSVAYRHLIRTAGIVAIPTKLMAYPTGQTVALEAAATGAALILTDTPPMREYFDDDTAVMVAPGDVEGWRRAVRQLSSDEGLRHAIGHRAAEHVRANFTYLQMWQQVDGLLRDRGWVA